MKALSNVIYYLLLTALFVVAGILFLPVLPIENNIETKVVLSGSMEPAIKVGSVIVIKPQEKYNIGDIITFGEDTRTSIPTTHRIIDTRLQNGELYFQTKGDANQDPDNRETTADDVLGKVLFSIPFLGFIIDYAKQPIGFALLIIIPAAVIILDEVRKIIIEVIRMRKRKVRKEEVNRHEQ